MLIMLLYLLQLVFIIFIYFNNPYYKMQRDDRRSYVLGKRISHYVNLAIEAFNAEEYDKYVNFMDKACGIDDGLACAKLYHSCPEDSQKAIGMNLCYMKMGGKYRERARRTIVSRSWNQLDESEKEMCRGYYELPYEINRVYGTVKK